MTPDPHDSLPDSPDRGPRMLAVALLWAVLVYGGLIAAVLWMT